jgi:hypothetical protein
MLEQTIEDRSKEPAFAFGVANKKSVWIRGAYCKSPRFVVVLNGQLSERLSTVRVGSLSNDQQRMHVHFLRGLWEQV